MGLHFRPFSGSKIQKTIPQKIDFLCTFCDFMYFLANCWPFWVDFGTSMASFFDDFRISNFDIISWTFFWEKMQKLKNWKHSSGPVNYSVSWRSRDLKIYPQLWKSASFFHSFFHEKTSQNRVKNRMKRWVHYKSMKTRSLGPLFGPRVDFGLFWGSQRGPQNYQKLIQSFQIKAQLAWGGGQEAPRINFNRFLNDFGMIFGFPDGQS